MADIEIDFAAVGAEKAAKESRKFANEAERAGRKADRSSRDLKKFDQEMQKVVRSSRRASRGTRGANFQTVGGGAVARVGYGIGGRAGAAIGRVGQSVAAGGRSGIGIGVGAAIVGLGVVATAAGIALGGLQAAAERQKTSAERTVGITQKFNDAIESMTEKADQGAAKLGKTLLQDVRALENIFGRDTQEVVNRALADAGPAFVKALADQVRSGATREGIEQALYTVPSAIRTGLIDAREATKIAAFARPRDGGRLIDRDDILRGAGRRAPGIGGRGLEGGGFLLRNLEQLEDLERRTEVALLGRVSGLRAGAIPLAERRLQAAEDPREAAIAAVNRDLDKSIENARKVAAAVAGAFDDLQGIMSGVRGGAVGEATVRAEQDTYRARVAVDGMSP